MMIINPYLTGSSQGGFVPSGNLTVWLKADVGVTYNISNQVATWSDQSGNILDAFQNTTSYKPTYVASNANFNNKPSINFVAGSDDFLYLPTSALLNFSSGFTIYVVGKLNAITNTFNTIIQHSNGSTWTQGWGIFYYNADPGYRFFVNNWNNAANYVSLNQSNTASSQIYKFKWDGTTITAAILGSVPVSGTKAFSGPYTNPSANNPEIARGASTIYDTSCDISEILMYNSGSLGASNEAGIETYLKTKYGIA